MTNPQKLPREVIATFGSECHIWQNVIIHCTVNKEYL